MDKASAWGLKGSGFDSGQGHVPWLLAYPQYGMCKRQLIDDTLSSLFLTLYLSPFLSVQNKIYFFKKIKIKKFSSIDGILFVLSSYKNNDPNAEDLLFYFKIQLLCYNHKVFKISSL
ncbi:unnamed protein product [Pipistrellus nathusii]|uniref:Uncharacterized protein n=1 Tax=Pipistrellus nathusii TaxID=59473 RepID=A0ABP0A889_PIPNA